MHSVSFLKKFLRFAPAITARRPAVLAAILILTMPAPPLAAAGWLPPAEISRDEIIRISSQVLSMPDIPIKTYEDVIRVRAVGLDWDVGARIYEPVDPDRILHGADGRKAGAFLLHGGAGDYRAMDKIARLMASKYGFKVVAMTYPGRLYFRDPDHNWPGDTIHDDGTVRTPIWIRGENITPDQYVVRRDQEPSRRERWGTLILACAKQGTDFWDRMAGWPVAFEISAKALMHKHLPAPDYSIYITGHSTGGPFADMLTQRVANIAGVIGMESAPFGYIAAAKLQETSWNGIPFQCLRIRSWRDTARYAGPEALAKDGPDALNHLPELMEKVLNSWKKSATSPQFKAENIIHFNARDALRKAALATAARLKLNRADTQALVERYIGYTHELRGPGVKPVPPLLLGIARTSTDYTIEKYRDIVIPMYLKIRPQPKVHLVHYLAGTHSYARAGPDLPMGPFPAVLKTWHDAIVNGYFVTGDGSRQR